MINLKYQFEKNKFNKERNEELMLLELEGFSIEDKKQQSKQLNISLCIDISGSMRMNLKGQDMYFHQSVFEIRGFQEVEFNPRTKLDLVKSAAIKAVDAMNDGDIISVVAFDNRQILTAEPVSINKETREEVKRKINTLQPMGSTNIHSGWLSSVEQVAKNVDSIKLNRVILLTDGQIVSGENNIDVIAKDVFNIANKGISLSCFGVGDDFNEDLLQAMSDSGNGNFYFIDEDKNFDIMFNEEFSGLSNVCATGVSLSLTLERGIKIKEDFNNLKKSGDLYSLQDFTSSSKMSILFKLDTSKYNHEEIRNLGKIELSYKDKDGIPRKEIIEPEVESVSQSKWNNLEENKEIKVQELLLTVAKNKLKARKAINNGNKSLAESILRSSSQMVSASVFCDDRLKEETDVLCDTLDSVNSKSNKELSKTLLYQNYKLTRQN